MNRKYTKDANEYFIQVQTRLQFKDKSMFSDLHTVKFNGHERVNCIFDYGRHFPLAFVIGDTAFINCHRYSLTTAKHIRQIKSQLNNHDWNCIELPDYTHYDLEQNLKLIIEHAKARHNESIRARQHKGYKRSMAHDCIIMAKRLRKFIKDNRKDIQSCANI